MGAGPFGGARGVLFEGGDLMSLTPKCDLFWKALEQTRPSMAMVDLSDNMVDLPNTMVDHPNTMVDLPNTMLDLPSTIVDLPNTLVDLLTP